MIILISGGTIIISSLIEILQKLKILKKIANKGYKIKKFKLLDNFLILIPFINIFITFKNIFENKSIKNLSIEQLKSQTKYIPFSNKEKNMYSKNKNVLTAFKLNLTNYIDPNMILIFKNQEEENIIYFSINDGHYLISSIKGPLSKNSKKIQYKILEEQLSDINCTNNNYNVSQKLPHQKKENIKIKINKYQNLKQSLIQENKDEKQKVYKKIA